METVKQHAKDMVLKFFSVTHSHSEAKKCALICVDEIVEAGVFATGFWSDVKEEIEKL